MSDRTDAASTLLRSAPDLDALMALSLAGLAEASPPPRIPGLARRGRGAVTNPAARFERHAADPFDDGWATLGADLPPLPTTLLPDASRTVTSWNDSPDLGFDRAVNPYRGCEHGCIYCYARPSHAFLGYSPGLDFETRIVLKPNVAALLEGELSRPDYTPRPLVLGSNTDPYQPVERTLGLSRTVLEVLERFGHPVSIVTKSAGVLRDLDVLRRMAARGLVRVWLSVTTLDSTLARGMEPRAAAPARRLATVEALSRAEVPVGVLAAPMIPGLNDAEMERILQHAAGAGARHAGYVLLRLPHELRDLFTAWLQEHVPDRARHVLSLIRETRAGALNDSRFGQRFTGVGAYADLLARRFSVAAKRLGFENRQGLDCTQFAVPAAAGAQLSLL